MTRLPFLTLVVDGSYGDRGHAGWAAWYRADGVEPELVGGVVGRELFDVKSSNDVEAAAMVLGLVAALDYAPRHSVLLQTDSTSMIKAATRILGWEQRVAAGGYVVPPPARRLGHSPVERLACRLMEQVVEAAGVPVFLRYVRGHASGPGVGAVHAVHSRCDYWAKSYMRKARTADGLSPSGLVMPKSPVDGLVCES